jgi:hypothetical protein
METLRRSAFKQARNPSGHLSGSATELAILELLRDYRYLPTPYVKAGVNAGPQYVEDVLTNLVDKHYVGIPEAAKDRCKTKAVPYVYELLPRGLAFLAKNGRQTQRAVASNWFEHDVLACTVQFSFDQAPKEVPGLKKRTSQSILRHENCPPATRSSLTPFTIQTRPPLNADADPFGLEFNGRMVFFHGFEADNGTETIATTVRRKIDRYQEYLESKGPVRMFGMPTDWMHILFVTTSQDRADHIAEYFPSDKFHAKATSGFDTKFPLPDARMVTEPWTQKGGKTWSILEHLGVAHGQSRKG